MLGRGCTAPVEGLQEEHPEHVYPVPQQTTGTQSVSADSHTGAPGGRVQRGRRPWVSAHVTLSSCPWALCSLGKSTAMQHQSHSCTFMNKWETFPIKIQQPPPQKSKGCFPSFKFFKKRF